MKAVILAGGLGTRLNSILSDEPKVMAPIRDRPFLEYLLDLLKAQGFRDYVLCVGYKKERIVDYFGDGSKFGARIQYCVEEQPLGTGGALKNAEPWLGDDFLLLNGDTYAQFNYESLVRFHRQQGAKVTIAVAKVADWSRYGKVELDEVGRIITFEEKKNLPKRGKSGLVSVGVYVFSPEVFRHIQSSGEVVSLEREVIHDLLEQRLPVFGYPIDGFFFDIGTPESYTEAQKYFSGLGKGGDKY